MPSTANMAIYAEWTIYSEAWGLSRSPDLDNTYQGKQRQDCPRRPRLFRDA